MAVLGDLLTRPEGRMSQRVNLYLPLRITGKNSEGHLVEEHALSINIGVEGLYMLTTHKWAENKNVRLAIFLGKALNLDVTRAFFQCRATVVRFDPVASDGFHGLALRFNGDFKVRIGPCMG